LGISTVKAIPFKWGKQNKKEVKKEIIIEKPRGKWLEEKIIIKEKDKDLNSENEEVDGYYISYIAIPKLGKNKKVSSHNSGYVPYPIPTSSNRMDWQEAYHEQLIEMYMQTFELINNRNNVNTNPYNNDKFNFFCKIIYDSSSKHI